MAREHVADDTVDGFRIVDPSQPVGLHDFGGPPARRVHLFEHVFCHGAGNRARIDEADQLGKGIRLQGNVGRAAAGLVHLARQLPHDPVAGGLGVAARRRHAFEVVGERHRLCQDTGVVFRQPILVDEPSPPRVGQLRQRAANLFDRCGVER